MSLSFTVFPSSAVELRDAEIRATFDFYLDQLKMKCHLRGIRVMQWDYDHPHNGESNYIDIGSVDDPSLQIVVAAIRLKDLLREKS